MNTKLRGLHHVKPLRLGMNHSRHEGVASTRGINNSDRLSRHSKAMLAVVAIGPIGTHSDIDTCNTTINVPLPYRLNIALVARDSPSLGEIDLHY